MQLETCDKYQSANHHIRLKMLAISAISNMTFFLWRCVGKSFQVHWCWYWLLAWIIASRSFELLG